MAGPACPQAAAIRCMEWNGLENWDTGQLSVRTHLPHLTRSG